MWRILLGRETSCEEIVLVVFLGGRKGVQEREREVGEFWRRSDVARLRPDPSGQPLIRDFRTALGKKNSHLCLFCFWNFIACDMANDS